MQRKCYKHRCIHLHLLIQPYNSHIKTERFGENSSMKIKKIQFTIFLCLEDPSRILNWHHVLAL